MASIEQRLVVNGRIVGGQIVVLTKSRLVSRKQTLSVRREVDVEVLEGGDGQLQAKVAKKLLIFFHFTANFKPILKVGTV